MSKALHKKSGMVATAAAAADKKSKPGEKVDPREGGAPEGEGEFVKSLTAKQIKGLARPEFEKNPEKFYPTKTLTRLGYSRHQCGKCKHFYWRHTDKAVTCGDSNCEQKYHFIGKGTGIGRKGKKITYAQAWEGFRNSLSKARVPCTPIARYPVVARWRADVDYVAAGIFCFQPYCVTGELEPPANPLICPQFCLRFNDLDNIGLTGRHYSGFIMLGIQVFNKKDNYKFWNDECIEFNYDWLTKELEIDPDEITFIEDVWAGGGNLGPSIEYFVGGLELGNMVFMQFKTFPDGRREPLQVQVIDVGIGLERVPWLINGSATSYMDVFPRALKVLTSAIDLPISSTVWDKYGPYSCLLNVDEVENLDQTWAFIANKIDMKAPEVKAAIEPVRDAYIVLDHTRSILMAVTDGSLPSNQGGAANIRNQLRRVFAILAKRGWSSKLGMDAEKGQEPTLDGLFKIFDAHKEDLATIYGPFADYPSFRKIITLEFKRWKFTDTDTKAKLEKHLKKSGGKLTNEDWMLFISSFGIPVDTISAISGLEVPGKLFLEMAEKAETMQKAVPTVLYSTAHLAATESIFYKDDSKFEFDGKVLEVMPNLLAENHPPSVVILDRSSFYPTSGGQEHDTGKLTIDGKTYEVKDVQKVGPCVLHFIDPPLPADKKLDSWKGSVAHGSVDVPRREQLRNHHTATHIVFAACRKVLGPHIWQHGAKKTIDQAHLDITHYESLTHAENLAIENEANRIVHRCKSITKSYLPKDVAERKYGFSLYQGGVVPGNELRVVDIAGTDTEACCGTHCDNTAQVGTIKIMKSTRISDGILRLYYVAGENAMRVMNEDSKMITELLDEWAVPQKDLLVTGQRFFDGYKKYNSEMPKKQVKIVDLTMKVALLDPTHSSIVFKTDETDPTLFIRSVPQYAAQLKATKKSVVFVGDGFAYGVSGVANPTAEADCKALIKSIADAEEKKKADKAAADKKKADKKGKDAKDSKDDSKKGKKDKSSKAAEAVPAATAVTAAAPAAVKAPGIKVRLELPGAADVKAEKKAVAADAAPAKGDGKAQQPAKKKGGNMVTDVAEFQITNLPGSVADAIAFYVAKGYVEQAF